MRILANVIAAPDLSAEEEEAVLGGRAVTYLIGQGFSRALVDANGWDEAVLHEMRAHPSLAGLGDGPAGLTFTRQQLVETSRLIPRDWLTSGAAVGTATYCADRLKAFIDAGAVDAPWR